MMTKILWWSWLNCTVQWSYVKQIKSYKQQDHVVLKLVNEKKVWSSSSEWLQCNHDVNS